MAVLARAELERPRAARLLRITSLSSGNPRSRPGDVDAVYRQHHQPGCQLGAGVRTSGSAENVQAAGSGWATAYFTSVHGAGSDRGDASEGAGSVENLLAPGHAAPARTVALWARPPRARWPWSFGVFELVTILIAHFGAEQLAGHQIAIIIISTSWMMPFGISSAAAVRVGYGLGRRDPGAAARSGWAALKLGAIAMSSGGDDVTDLRRPGSPADVHVAAGRHRTRRNPAPHRGFFPTVRRPASGRHRRSARSRRYANFDAVPLRRLLDWWVCRSGPFLWCFPHGMGAAGLWIGLSAGLILIGITLTLLWARAARAFPMLK